MEGVCQEGFFFYGLNLPLRVGRGAAPSPSGRLFLSLFHTGYGKGLETLPGRLCQAPVGLHGLIHASVHFMVGQKAYLLEDCNMVW